MGLDPAKRVSVMVLLETVISALAFFMLGNAPVTWQEMVALLAEITSTMSLLWQWDAAPGSPTTETIFNSQSVAQTFLTPTFDLESRKGLPSVALAPWDL